MSKFLDTQFSVTGIKNFDIAATYLQYDLVDFEYYTGDLKTPTNLSGLFAWYNLDSLNNLEFDSSGKISKWYNSAPGFEIDQDLNNNSVSSQTRPFYDQIKNSVTCKCELQTYSLNQLFTTGVTDDHYKGLLTNDRCWIIVYEFDDLRRGDYGYTVKPNISTIINTDYKNTAPSSSGFIGVSGNNEIYSWNSNVPKTSQQIIINPDGAAENSPISINAAFTAAKPLKNKNILSIIKNNTTNNLVVRNNGCVVLDVTSSYFNTPNTNLRIGTAGNGHAINNALYNYDASNISYYEILGFAKVPTDNDILAIEKYLFEKHFTNDDGLYIASQNFTASNYAYSPLNITGSNYLTKNIDNIFNKTYGCSVNFSTKAKRIDFGDNYYTNVISNINNLNSEFTLSYDGLTDKQAKAIIGFFQNTFEYTPKNILDSYQNVDIDLFFPYKNNAKIYFSDLQYNSTEANLNKIDIKCVSAYDSSLDYRGFSVTGADVTKFFEENKNYLYNDVVYYNSISANTRGYYWFTGLDNTFVNHSTSPTGANSLFTRSFYFKPDLNFDIAINPKYIKTEFDSSAASFENYGINKTSLEFNFTFSNRSDKEAQSILKFLDSNAGFKIFEIKLPDPYNKIIDVYSPEWSHTYKFKNNHDISVKFLEFKGLTDSDIFFNTLLKL